MHAVVLQLQIMLRYGWYGYVHTSRQFEQTAAVCCLLFAPSAPAMDQTFASILYELRSRYAQVYSHTYRALNCPTEIPNSANMASIYCSTTYSPISHIISIRQYLQIRTGANVASNAPTRVCEQHLERGQPAHHISAHFAIDHEGRTTGGYRSSRSAQSSSSLRNLRTHDRRLC